MEAIDQARFNFSPTVGRAVGVMVGFLVFAAALDLTWDQFHRVLRRPKAPLRLDERAGALHIRDRLRLRSRGGRARVAAGR